MTNFILVSSLIGGLYLIFLFVISAAICIFVKLCVYYYRTARKKPAPQKTDAPEPKPEPKAIKVKPRKKPAPRAPVHKIIIDPDAVNKIYVRSDKIK